MDALRAGALLLAAAVLVAGCAPDPGAAPPAPPEPSGTTAAPAAPATRGRN